MIRKLALFLPAFCSLLLLSACKQNSTVFGTDTRNYTGQVTSTIPNTYSGKVIDGPMANARVWLDINGNGLYDKTVSVTVGSGPSQKTLTIPGGEPTAMTDSNGNFSLDVSSLKFNPDVASDLDPRNYPLMAVVIPNKTVDQGGNGSPEKNAYLMMSPPGQTIVSPLTTYIEATRKYCSPVGGSCDLAVTDIQNTLGVTINLESDYIKANDPVSAAYARAFGYFLGLETPSTYSQTLSGTDGLANVFDAASQKVINTIFIKQGPKLIQTVDQAAKSGSGYANMDVSQIGINAVPPGVSDPEVLYKQTVYLDGATEPQKHSVSEFQSVSSYVSAVLSWKYTPAGQVSEISVDGLMDPSLISLSRLADAKGYVANMDRQGLLWFFDKFNPGEAGKVTVGDGKADEVLVFDWTQNKAYYYSDYSGHGATSSALGDITDPSQAQDVFSWKYNINGRVTQVSDNTRTMTISYNGTSAKDVSQYSVTKNSDNSLLRSWTFGTPQVCNGSTVKSPADSLDIPVTVQENQNASSASALMSWAYDNLMVPSGSDSRGQIQRLSFINQNLISTNPQGYMEWWYSYPTTPLDSDQPYLIQSAALNVYDQNLKCGFSSYPPTGNLYAYVTYDYEHLSKYILDNYQ